jgi:O-antigen/teichoic acid export membrane protein
MWTRSKPSLGRALEQASVRRLLNGAGANVLRQAINIGSEITMVPFLLAYWGSGLYGEWQILSAAVVYITVLDFGTHTYATNLLNQAYSRGEIDQFNGTLHSALAIALGAATLALLVILPGIAFAPLDRWLPVQVTNAGTAATVLFFLALHAALALPIAVLGGIYRAVGEYARDIMVNNAYRVISCVLSCVAVAFGGGLVQFSVIQLVCFASALAYIVIDLRIRHPEVRLGFGRCDSRVMLAFVVPSLLFFLVQASASAVVQGTVLLIGFAAGTTAVAVFTTLRTLVNGIPQVVNSVSGTLWPELTSLDAKGDADIVRDLHRLSAKVVFFLGICAAVFLHFTGADIIKLWTGPRIPFDPLLFDSLLVLELIASWCLASSTLLAALNEPRTLAICQSVATAGGLTLGYICGLHWGSTGVVMGLLIANVVTIAWAMPLAACRRVRQSFLEFSSHVLIRGLLVLIGVSAGVGATCVVLAGTPTLLRILIIWTVTGGIGLPLLLGWWLTDGERALLRTFLPKRIVSILPKVTERRRVVVT